MAEETVRSIVLPDRTRTTPRLEPDPGGVGATSLAGDMPSYRVNQAAVRHAKQLIESRQYVLETDWGDAQPSAETENAFLERRPWSDYAAWHLGLTGGASDDTKARYAFVYGDFRRLHRSGLIACVYRAAEWRHKEVELAAHRLLQALDKKTLKR